MFRTFPSKVWACVTRFVKKCEEGATIVEYALLVALISVVAIVAIYGIGLAVKTTFTNVQTTMESVPATPTLPGSGGGGTTP